MSNELPTLDFAGHHICNLSPIQLTSYLEAAIGRNERIRLEGLNVAKFIQAQSDFLLHQALAEAEIVHVDGSGISLGAKMLGLPLAPRIAGIDLMQELCEVCARNGWSIYLLGARHDVVVDAAAALMKKFPDLIIAGYRDGFFKESEVSSVVADIARCAPKLLLIGISSPKKELFVHHNWEQLNTAITFGVGGSFDVISGRIPRAPRWMQKFGMEWLFRLLQEPRRLTWRYASTNSIFLYILTKLIFSRLYKNIAMK